MRTTYPASEFLTDYDEWLRTQNGEPPQPPACSSIRRRATSRPAATSRSYVHPSPALAWAASLLLATPAVGPDPRYGGLYPPAQPALTPRTPTAARGTQTAAGATFGLPYVQALLAEGTSHATRASYWQKWFVHRTLRPEAYGGLAHHRLANGVSDYPLHDDFLRSQALERTRGEVRHLSAVADLSGGRAAALRLPRRGPASVAGVSADPAEGLLRREPGHRRPGAARPADPTRLVPYSRARR